MVLSRNWGGQQAPSSYFLSALPLLPVSSRKEFVQRVGVTAFVAADLPSFWRES